MELDEDTVRSLVRGLGDGEESALAIFALEPPVLARVINLAVGMIELGKLAQAESLLIDLSDLLPRSGTTSYLLGDCRLERGDAAGALRAFGAALERVASPTDQRLAQLAHLGRARAFFQMGDAHGARTDLEHVRNGEDERLAELAQAALEALPADGATR